jgi:hypothetical protein
MAILLAHCHISSKGITQRAARSLTSKQMVRCLPAAVQSLIDTTANNIVRKSNLTANYKIRRVFFNYSEIKA